MKSKNEIKNDEIQYIVENQSTVVTVMQHESEVKNNFENNAITEMIFETQKKKIIMNTSNLSANEEVIANTSNLSARICLNDLNDENKKRLKQKAMKKKSRIYRVRFYRKFEFEKNTI